MSEQLAEVGFSCGRCYLKVAGLILVMEGDSCRDGEMPKEVYDPIPEDELQRATIGDHRAVDLPIKVVRFFRGDRWTSRMLEYAAATINAAATKESNERCRS